MTTKKFLSLNEQIEGYSAFQKYMQKNATSRSRHKRMEQLLHIAMQTEMTEKQKVCVELYYFQKMKVCDIAGQLSIRPTTVYKHLKKARASLSKCLPYLSLEEK